MALPEPLQGNYLGINDKKMFASGLGGVLGGIFGGGKNPADAANPYFDQIMQMLPGYFQPYMDAGKNGLDQASGQYGRLVNDPTSVMNQIGKGYQQSPGYQFQVDQARQAANRAAAAGGMAGSPAEQQALAGTVNQLANQDYNQYVSQGLNQYNTGLSGFGNLAGMGLQASTGLGEDLASVLESQAKLAYEGQNQKNQAEGGLFGGIGGIIGSFL